MTNYGDVILSLAIWLIASGISLFFLVRKPR